MDKDRHKDRIIEPDYVCFNPWFNGLMDKDTKTLQPFFCRVYCFNPWFNGLMDKDFARVEFSSGKMKSFNPWFNGLMDKDIIFSVCWKSLFRVSTLGLMD